MGLFSSGMKTAAPAVIDGARKKAEALGVPVNVAVVDEGANHAFDTNTKDLAKISQPGEPAYGIASSTEHRIAIFPDGVPLMAGGKVVGAVGVSGGKPDQDHAVAGAGADALPKS